MKFQSFAAAALACGALCAAVDLSPAFARTAGVNGAVGAAPAAAASAAAAPGATGPGPGSSSGGGAPSGPVAVLSVVNPGGPPRVFHRPTPAIAQTPVIVQKCRFEAAQDDLIGAEFTIFVRQCVADAGY